MASGKKHSQNRLAESCLTGGLRNQGGFALISVLALMALLALLVIGILQLSTVSLRASGRDRAMAEARANARVALTLAIGQLQTQMGPDQRITATAAMKDQNPATKEVEGVANPHYTGVWTAAPAVTVANMDATAAPSSTAFRSWLVSGEGVTTPDFAAKSQLTGDTNARTMVGAGTVANAADQVRVPVIKAPQAGMAWWTADNGEKATLRASAEERDQAPGDLASVLAASRRFHPDGYHAADAALPVGRGKLQKLLDLATADVAVDQPAAVEDQLARKYFHDLTTQSEMIPVDVTTGKLKRCMDLRLAWLQDQTDAIRVAEGTFGPPSGGAGKNYTLFSWDQLRSAMSYTQDPNGLLFDANGRPYVKAFMQYGYNSSANAPSDEIQHNPSMNRERWRIAPVPVKVMYVVSCAAENVPVDPSRPTWNLGIYLYVYPIIVLWNPYNVDLVVPEYCMSTWNLPVRFSIDYTRAPSMSPANKQFTLGGMHAAFGRESPNIPGKLSNLVIPAGENRILTAAKFDPTLPGNNRGSGGNHPELYIWLQQKPFDMAGGTPPNYGVPYKFLLNDPWRINLLTANDSYNTVNGQLAGATSDTFKISASLIAPAGGVNYESAGEHTDLHANSGVAGATDHIRNAYWYSYSSSASFNLSPNSPQVSMIPAVQAPTYTFGEVRSSANGGRPVMIFTCQRKTLDETIVPNKNWAFDMPAHPYHAQLTQGTASDYTTATYESGFTYSMKGVTTWLDVANEIQQSQMNDNQAYMGTSSTAQGQLRALAQEIPLVAPVSLAQFQHLPLFDYKPEYAVGSDLPIGPVNFVNFTPGDFMRGRAVQFAQNNAIGNSYASPGIPSTAISTDGWKFRFSEFSSSMNKRMDRSYIANKLLWDAWWCSSLSPQNGPFYAKYGQPRAVREVADQFFNGQRMLPNEAYQVHTEKPADEVLQQLFDGPKLKKDADGKLAEYIRIQGGFNVNSTSVKAWEQLYAQMLSRPTVVMDAAGAPPRVQAAEAKKFLISRYSLGVGGPAERAVGASREDRWWDGSRELSADEIAKLAEATVREVKKRGPFLSMADFVNRSLVADKSLALKGALQAALDDPATGINTPLATLTVPTPPATRKPTYPFPEAAEGALRQGIPGWVTQADLLQTIGPVLSPRSDTFTIRAMGEARDKEGKVLATAWCEAVIQRSVEYMDSQEPANTATVDLKRPLNKTFGRRMDIVSFRWLPTTENNQTHS